MVALKEVVDSNETVTAQKDERRGLEPSTRRASVRSDIRLALRVGASIAFIVAATFVLFRLIPVNATTAGFLFLVATLTDSDPAPAILEFAMQRGITQIFVGRSSAPPDLWTRMRGDSNSPAHSGSGGN